MGVKKLEEKTVTVAKSEKGNYELFTSKNHILWNMV